MIITIIEIVILIGTVVGFALLAIRCLGNDTRGNDVGEQAREPVAVHSFAPAFDQNYAVTEGDVSNSNVDEQDKEPFTVFSVAQAFDRDCAIIWSTQISALRLVDNAAKKGVAIKLLYPFYTRGVRRYPELYDGSSFGTWLEFLERERLLKRSGLQIFITADGHQFLEYRLAPESIHAA